MAVSFDSLATAKARVLGFFRTQLGDWDLSSKGFFGKFAAVITLALYSFLRVARQIDNDAVPTENTSTAGLDEWATNGTGIPDGDGGYGRKAAVVATGGVGTFTGTPGTVYLANSTLTASDGVTKYVLTNGPITVGGGGTVSGNIDATTAGDAGNQPVAAVLTVDSVPVGGSGSVTLTTALTGGLDEEANSTLLERIRVRLRNPPKGGTANDYRVWLENATNVSTGVAIPITRAYVYPWRYGTGTVDAVITQSGSGTSRAPSAGNQTAAQDYLDSVRPVTVSSARVLLPDQPGANGLAIVLRPVPTLAANAFSFDSTTGGPYAVDAGTTTSSLVLDANCADLDEQVNTLGKTPLIQIITTGVVLPQVTTVTAYNAGTFTATLSPALDTLPTAGDAVYAASPMVLPIATALLAVVDALGPSRASGFADADDEWNDTLAIDEIIHTALDVEDDSGTPYAKNLLATPTINGVSVDVTGADNSTDPPELLYVESITVKP